VRAQSCPKGISVSHPILASPDVWLISTNVRGLERYGGLAPYGQAPKAILLYSRLTAYGE